MMQPLIVSLTDYLDESICLHELCHGETCLMHALLMKLAPSLTRMNSAIIERVPQSALQKVILVEEDM